MVRIYSVTIQLCHQVAPLCTTIARHDPDLARQLRRALSSVPLNTAEGSYSRGRNRHARYHTALGSAAEAKACLEVASAFGYIEPLPQDVVNTFAHVIGTLHHLARG